MTKLTSQEFWKRMSERCEAVHDGKETKHLTGVIVYSNSNAHNGNWNKEYPLESRSYKVSSNNKCFGSWYCGYSLYGSSLDGSDMGVRLEHIEWDIEYCYILDEETSR